VYLKVGCFICNSILVMTFVLQEPFPDCWILLSYKMRAISDRCTHRTMGSVHAHSTGVGTVVHTCAPS
jgi:hypothetical protein